MYRKIIEECLDLWHTYVDSGKIGRIRIGQDDYNKFVKTDDFDFEIKDVAILLSSTKTEGIYFYPDDQKNVPYAIILDEIANYMLENDMDFPDTTVLSPIFMQSYECYSNCDFSKGQILFDTELDFSNELEYIVLCKKDFSASKILDNEFYNIDTSIISTDLIEPMQPVAVDPEEFAKAKAKIEKDRFIDWLINDDDTLLDAMESAEEKFFKIDREFEYYMKEREFEKWLEENWDDKKEP